MTIKLVNLVCRLCRHLFGYIPLCVALNMALAPGARAHDPFDATTHVVVFDERIEVTITLGYDAARAWVDLLELPPAEASRMTRAGGRDLIDLPPAAASWLFQLVADGAPLQAQSLVAAPHNVEIPFRIIYPRPASSDLRLRASYFDRIEYMRAGTVTVLTPQSRLLGSALVSRDRPEASLPLVLPAGAAQAGAHGFAAYFRLGVEHILSGFDHLLFLAALLLGVRRARTMLVIVTVFTLAHSVTLGVAAFDAIVLPPRVVEPLIAVSIVIVGLENILRRGAVADRYWLAGAFGLIHGFGFAGLLRETVAGAGGGMAVPLLGFNLGVEAGQLLVAGLAVPLLLLLRRNALFEREGVRVLSGLVIAISAVWVWQRLGEQWA